MTQVKVMCSLQQRQIHHVHSKLPLKQVALGSCGSHVIIHNKGMIGSAGLPYGLDRAYDKTEYAFDFVSLGRAPDNEDIWFYKDSKGSTLVGDSSCTTLRNAWWGGNGDHFVEQVWFAPYGGWYLTKSGGGARWSGLPDSLDESLSENWDELDGVTSLSIGHNGEWFALFGDGYYEWCGVHPVLADLLESKEDMTGPVRWVELGPDGSFVALFRNHTVWFGDEGLTQAMYEVMPRRR